MAWGYGGGFPRYVPVAERRRKAGKQLEKLRKQGRTVEPVVIDGRVISRSFWGKGWCTHLESFSDFENRLPRGRAYVRNGSVCHLEIHPGRIEALVSGSRMYTVNIGIQKIKPATWKSIKARCTGQVGSMLELLQGRLSNEVMAVVTHRETGLFPRPGEIQFDCSCPDWATMCKHVAAVLYGVANQLDRHPGLLFTLRGVDAEELIAEELALPAASRTDSPTISEDHIGSIFGIDLDQARPAPGTARRAPRADVGKTKPLPRLRPTGKSVARLRQRTGDTVSEFARRLGVSTSTVYRWESTEGRLTLKPRILEALAGLNRKT